MLIEKLDEILDNGHKVVVFSQFVSLLNRIDHALKEKFPNIPVFELTGKTLDRSKPVRQFQELDGAGVILVSLRAGGTGITLHSADYVFLMDPWWNPAVEEQAIDRVHRIGQGKPVFVYRMVTSGTIESRIQKLKTTNAPDGTKLLDVATVFNDVGNTNSLVGGADQRFGHAGNVGADQLGHMRPFSRLRPRHGRRRRARDRERDQKDCAVHRVRPPRAVRSPG